MSAASDQRTSYSDRGSMRQRATALLLAIAANLLIVIMLLSLAPAGSIPLLRRREMATFQLMPDTPVAPPGRAVTKTKRAAGGASRRSPRPPAAPPATATAPAASSISPRDLVVVSKDVLAATDAIMNVPHHGTQVADASAADGRGAGTGKGSDDGAGEGPGGEHLYNAEWYTRPTNAEMAYYMPHGPQRFGWGMVACRTIADYHVEDCVELGESPRGSGLSRTLRQAAWQFKVRPPRVGGRALVGAWVRIRFDFLEAKKDTGGGL